MKLLLASCGTEIMKRFTDADAMMDIDDAVYSARSYDYDLIVCKWRDVKRFRSASVKTPVIAIGPCETSIKIDAFGAGADDYISVPFDIDEVEARIKAVVRRSHGHAHPVIEIGTLRIDLDNKTVMAGDKRVKLTDKEYEVLKLLSLRKGKTITKELFLDRLYSGMDEPGIKIIDVFICKLRKKLSEATGGENYIETVWGHGYRIMGAKA